MFRSASNTGPSTASPATSSSRSARHPVSESVPQSTNNVFPSRTSAAPTFHRPRRFLLLAREKLDPAITSTRPASRVTSRSGSRFVDNIESDSTPPESASRDSQQNVPQSRKVSSSGSANHSVASASLAASSAASSRLVQRPISQSGRASDVVQVDVPVAASSSSRITRQPMPPPERNTGRPGLESCTIPPTSAARDSRPFPLPGTRNPGSTITSATPASYAAYQPTVQPVRHTVPTRAPVASSSRVAQQSLHQPTREALPAHNSASSASRSARQPTTQPPRASSTHTPSATLSRTAQQSKLRSVRATAAPLNTPSSSASASILEFICLYTHDLRRKKKRWQDGKLKFHTFNKKYMVYDDGGGFVGDGHWQGDESEVAEGLEMNLDRGMAIVQLLECTGSKEQDLGEVLGKRVREVEERRSSAAAKVSSSLVPSNPAKRSRGVATVVEPPPSTTLPTMNPLPPRNGAAGVAEVVEPTPRTTLPTMSPRPPRNRGAGVAVVIERALPATLETMVPLPPRNGGAWSTHAMDLLGMARPRRG